MCSAPLLTQKCNKGDLCLRFVCDCVWHAPVSSTFWWAQHAEPRTSRWVNSDVYPSLGAPGFAVITSLFGTVPPPPPPATPPGEAQPVATSVHQTSSASPSLPPLLSVPGTPQLVIYSYSSWYRWKPALWGMQDDESYKRVGRQLDNVWQLQAVVPLVS